MTVYCNVFCISSQRDIVNKSNETKRRKMTYLSPRYCLNSCDVYWQRNILLFYKPSQNTRYATLRNCVILFTTLPIVQSFIFSSFHWSWNYLFLRGVSFQVANTCLVFLPYLAYLCLLNAVLCEEFSNSPHSFFSHKWSTVIKYCEIKVIRVCNILQFCRKKETDL